MIRTSKKRQRTETIVIDMPRPKRRQEHMPTRRERDKSKDRPSREKVIPFEE